MTRELFIRMEDVPPQVWFGRYNFQREQDLVALSGFLRSPEGPSVVLLCGEPGIGRSYLLDAACFRLREEGLPVEVLRIDLEGFEEGGGLANYLKVQVQKRRKEEGRAREELIARLLGATELGLQGVGWATLFSVSLSLREPVAAVKAFFAAGVPGHAGPLVSPREAFSAFVESRPGRVVLHLPDPTQFHQVPSEQNPRRWLPEIAERFDRAVLVVSCRPGDSASALVPGARREGARIDLVSLGERDIAELLAARLPPNDFPADFAAALLRYSRGLPGMVGLAVGRLYRLGALNEGAGGTWRLEEGLAAQVLAEGLIEPVSQAIHTQGKLAPALWGFLLDAALCGDLVPAGLLPGLRGLADAEIQSCRDSIQSEFVERLGIFEDPHGHATFPKWIWMLRFREPLARLAILEHYAPRERRARAEALLAALHHVLEITTRDVARLFLSLAEHLGEGERSGSRRELEWWVGLEEAGELRQEVERDLKLGRLQPETLWEIIQSTEDRWPPARRLALLDAYLELGRGPERHGSRIPADRVGRLHATRADVLRDLGRYEEALGEALIARDLAKTKDGPRSHAYLQRLNLTGLLYVEVGDREAGRVDLLAANDLATRILSSDHPTTLTIRNNLGRVYRAQGELLEARQLFEEVARVKERVLGPEHPSTLSTKLNLAGVVEAQGDHPQAHRLYEASLEAHVRVLGPEHPMTLVAKSNFGHFLAVAVNDLGGARQLLEDAVEAGVRHRGPGHPSTLGAKINLAGSLVGQGDFARARRLVEEVIEVRVRDLGPEHPETVLARAYLDVFTSSGIDDHRSDLEST